MRSALIGLLAVTFAGGSLPIVQSILSSVWMCCSTIMSPLSQV